MREVKSGVDIDEIVYCFRYFDSLVLCRRPGHEYGDGDGDGQILEAHCIRQAVALTEKRTLKEPETSTTAQSARRIYVGLCWTDRNPTWGLPFFPTSSSA